MVVLIACGESETLDAEESASDFPSTQIPSDENCVSEFTFSDNWEDNCVVKRGGLYANSSYTLGIQRILWCTGFAANHGNDSASLSEFADGLFDEFTESSVVRYQNSVDLPAHGAVGTVTWQALRQELILIGAAAAEYRTYSISGERCKDEVHFYQRNTLPYDWQILIQPNGEQLVPFLPLQTVQNTP